MCIILCYTPHLPQVTNSPYALIIAANRDEYLSRPTRDAAFHNFEPLDSASGADTIRTTRCLSGRDAQDPVGGTWFGLSIPETCATHGKKVLRIGALTNIHDDIPLDPGPAGKRSRGGILKDYLQLSNEDDTKAYLRILREEKRRYDGFGLGLFDVTICPSSSPGAERKIEIVSFYYSNRLAESKESRKNSHFQVDDETTSGPWGMSNSLLSQPLDKVKEGNRLLSDLMDRSSTSTQETLIEDLFSILRTDHGPITSMEGLHQSISVPLLAMPSDGPLPANSPRNVTRDETRPEGRVYGTRLSTLVLVKKDGSVLFIERDRAGKEGERRFDFDIGI